MFVHMVTAADATQTTWQNKSTADLVMYLLYASSAQKNDIILCPMLSYLDSDPNSSNISLVPHNIRRQLLF